MANVGKITHVKTNIGNTFSFSDKSAIKKIIFGKQDKGTNGVYSPDSDGIVYIKLKDYSIATDESLGMVSVPRYLNDNQTENGIKLSQDGKITVNFPIKGIMDGSGNYLNINNSILQIPNANNNNYGLVKTSSNPDYCVKVEENGTLYIKFSEGWTDVCKETEYIDFNIMKDIGRLSLEEYIEE